MTRDAAGWRPGQRRVRSLCGALLAVWLGVAVVYLFHILTDIAGAAGGGKLPVGDFAALWAAARAALLYPSADLYNTDLLQARQATFGLADNITFPFPYPPPFIPFIAPLGLLPFALAFPLVMLAGLALFVLAVRFVCTRRGFLIVACAIVPVTAATLSIGQLGLFVGALATFGIRLAATRPVLAGVSIGLLAFKPQLGLMFPVALIAARRWTTIVSAGATIALLGLATTVALGTGIWIAWLGMLPGYIDWFDTFVEVRRLCPSVLAMLTMFGVPQRIAEAGQWLTTLCVAVVIWRGFRRAAGKREAALLLTGAILAAPHALFYDLPMTMAAIALFVDDRLDHVGFLRTREVAAVALGTLFPLFMLQHAADVPVAPLCLALLFWTIARASAEPVVASASRL